MPRKRSRNYPKFSHVEPEKNVWKDEGRGIWTIRSKNLRISVHPFLDCPGQLFVSCYFLGIERVELKESESVEAAKAEALRYVRSRLSDLTDEMDQILLAQET